MRGPCMCGDTHCPSCGPAQGNYRCPNCGMWKDDGGCADPALCDEANRLANEAEAKYWEDYPNGEVEE